MGSKACYFLGAIFCSMLFMPTSIHGVTLPEIRDLRAKHRFSCLLVFGDSSVDPGNNNRLTTSSKSNFLPYGKDFIGGRPTGRFCNGRLATDFISEALGFSRTVHGFLEPNITNMDLLRSVSFASAGSGYDELTSNLTNTISLNKQINYMKHYMKHLRQIVGYKKANEIISKAVIILSTGVNDYLRNYFLEPTRSKQFTLDKYQDYLVSRMRHSIQELHKIGAKRIAVAGVIPAGCMPLVLTFRSDGIHCVDKVNKAILSLNSKIQKELKSIQSSMKMKTFYIDDFRAIYKAIQNPKKYGFNETAKGCCGTGTYEIGDTCKGLDACKDPDKYIFWDSVHPTQKMYNILANKILKTVPYSFFV